MAELIYVAISIVGFLAIATYATWLLIKWLRANDSPSRSFGHSRFHVPRDEPKLHPILHRPHEYDISNFRYHVDCEDPSESFIEMTLQKNTDSVTLRFWQPINLKIEEGFPRPTRGMVFYDRSADGLENIKIEVSDFESSWGSITFCAQSVEKIVTQS